MCGIIGIFKSDGHAAAEVYEGLLMLQHRGQDSAGIVTYDGESFVEKKDNGLVKDVFNEEEIKEKLVGALPLALPPCANNWHR
jgi:amidophosphoribosyltransferase